MTLLPPLIRADSTRDALHRAAQVLANFQKAFIPALPNALHLSLLVRHDGLTTRPLSFGTLALDFTSGEVVCVMRNKETRFVVNGQSPRTLRDTLLDHLAASGVRGIESVKPSEDDAPLHFDSAVGGEYATALWTIYTSIARVRGDWLGAVTPMVVWPHGFDLSTLYFPGNTPDEHAQPHINIGFSPTSAGFPRPYLYAYVSPMPEGATLIPLPSLARWTTDSWTGVVIDYDALRATDHPVAALEDTLRTVFTRLLGLMTIG